MTRARTSSSPEREREILYRVIQLASSSLHDDVTQQLVSSLSGSHPQTSFGLAGMRERVELIGQRSVRSARDRGATRSIEVPIGSAEEVQV